MSKSDVVNGKGLYNEESIQSWRIDVNSGKVGPVYIQHSEGAGYGLYAKEAIPEVKSLHIYLTTCTPHLPYQWM